jgi:flagellar assembly factor FliW
VGVRPEDTITFPEGIPGFEVCRRFVLLSADEFAPFCCLQSLDPPAPSFLAVNPRAIVPTYRNSLSGDDRQRLGPDPDALVWLALVTLHADRGTTVNLRAPFVIDPARMIGYQIVPYRSCYPIDYPLEQG